MDEILEKIKLVYDAINELHRVLNGKPEPPGFEKVGVFSANPDLSEVIIKPIRGDVSEAFPFSKSKPKQPEPPLTAAEIMATNIYADHYIAISDSEAESANEITVSILAAQCALITIRHMIEVDPKSQFLRLIESEIQSINN